MDLLSISEAEARLITIVAFEYFVLVFILGIKKQTTTSLLQFLSFVVPKI